MNIAIPVFDGLTALDAVGPAEVLSRLPGANVQFLAAKPGPVQTETLTLVPDLTFDQLVNPEVVLVPGGPGTRKLVHDEQILGWLKRSHESSQWTTSVCTGSLLLGAAGILDGLEATTHWLALELLARYGAHPVRERVVRRGKVITAAGVSAGIDMALALGALIAGEQAAQAVQLRIEYDPQPPFDCGSPAKAPEELVERLRAEASSR